MLSRKDYQGVESTSSCVVQKALKDVHGRPEAVVPNGVVQKYMSNVQDHVALSTAKAKAVVETLRKSEGTILNRELRNSIQFYTVCQHRPFDRGKTIFVIYRYHQTEYE